MDLGVDTMLVIYYLLFIRVFWKIQNKLLFRLTSFEIRIFDKIFDN